MIAYSYAENSTTTTDQSSKKKKSITDAAARQTKVFEPDSGNNLTVETDYTYNVLDELLTVTDSPVTQTPTYQYDNLGRLTDRAEPETKNTASQGHYQYQYNNYDLVTQRTDPRSIVTTYGYDTLNRLHTIGYSDTTSGVTLNYGTSPTSNNNGRLTTMADGAGSEGYPYDTLGRMTQLQKTIGSTIYNTSYQYNVGNELTQITYPSGRVVQQAVDPLGRLCAIAQTASTCTTGTNLYASNYNYNNPASQLQGFNYGNGVTAALGYSSDRLQLTSLAYTKGATTLFSLTYAYGTAPSNNGQITKITDNVDNGRTLTLTYDKLARVASAVTTGSTGYPAWGLQWTYDRYGNRTSQSIKSGCVAPMTCPTNSLTFANPGGAQTNRPDGYNFDSNGNMLNDGSNTLTYDGENRAITSIGTLGSGADVYDGNKLRVKKCVPSCTSPTTTTVYVFSGSSVIAEYVNGAAPASPTREYIYSGGTLLAKIESGATQYYHPDHLSTRLMTDSTGTKIGEQGHYPFGESWYASSTTTKWQFTSYERDGESGNDYARARLYVSRFARFSALDPVAGSTADPQSLNRYTYSRNDPIDFVDPTGMDCAVFDIHEADYDSQTGEIISDTVIGTIAYCSVSDSGTLSVGRGSSSAAEQARDTAEKLLLDPDCSNFIAQALLTAFLNLAGDNPFGLQSGLLTAYGGGYKNNPNDETEPPQYAESSYFPLSRAIFQTSYTSDPSNPHDGPYTRIAGTKTGSRAVTLFAGFNSESPLAQAQTLIHEGVHDAFSFTDQQLETAVTGNQYGDSNSEQGRASNDFSSAVAAHCNKNLAH